MSELEQQLAAAAARIEELVTQRQDAQRDHIRALQERDAARAEASALREALMAVSKCHKWNCQELGTFRSQHWTGVTYACLMHRSGDKGVELPELAAIAQKALSAEPRPAGEEGAVID